MFFFPVVKLSLTSCTWCILQWDQSFFQCLLDRRKICLGQKCFQRGTSNFLHLCSILHLTGARQRPIKIIIEINSGLREQILWVMFVLQHHTTTLLKITPTLLNCDPNNRSVLIYYTIIYIYNTTLLKWCWCVLCNLLAPFVHLRERQWLDSTANWSLILKSNMLTIRPMKVHDCTLGITLNPSSQLIHMHPLVRKEPTTCRATSGIHPSWRSWRITASMKGKPVVPYGEDDEQHYCYYQ